MSGPNEFGGVVVVGFVEVWVVGFAFGKVGLPDPSKGGGAVAHRQETSLAWDATFDDVDPDADDAPDEFEEVDMGAAEQVIGDSETPGAAGRGEAADAVFASVGAVDMGGEAKGEGVHGETRVRRVEETDPKPEVVAYARGKCDGLEGGSDGDEASYAADKVTV